MKAIRKFEQHAQFNPAFTTNEVFSLEATIKRSWSKIAPFWPLTNLIAVNPIKGFEDYPFEDGLKHAQAYFQQPDIPEGMQRVNRESIKWLQVFFDKGQATIQMPNKNLGMLKSLLSLIQFDERLHHKDIKKKKWLNKLPNKPEAIIAESLVYLDIPVKNQELFLTLMLTMLPGWAAHIQYETNWANHQDSGRLDFVAQTEFLAFRLVLTCLLWPKAKELLKWHDIAAKTVHADKTYNLICANEIEYQVGLLKQFQDLKKPNQRSRSKAQFVFCIDVRSEPFRRALEAQDRYETYGFAGFFGLPVEIEHIQTGERHASCPVLVKPAHHILEYPSGLHSAFQDDHQTLQTIKKLF